MRAALFSPARHAVLAAPHCFPRSQLSKVDKQQARASEAIATQDARVRASVPTHEAGNHASAIPPPPPPGVQIAALGPEETAQLERLFESYTRSEMLVQQVEEFRAGCAEQLAELQVRGGGSGRQLCLA